MPVLDDIAIVGYAFKLPNGIEDDRNFWELLQNRRNLRTPWPESRANLGSFVGNGPSTLPSWAGHFIDEDVRSFDAPFFAVTAKEAASMDPLQRWTLEVSYRAFEAAGIPAENLKGSRTAVFAASMLEDYARLNAMDPDSIDRFAATGHAVSCIIPNRISWYFDLRGPSMHVNTACSSSLSAIDMACKTLHSGDANCAIVTGSNLLLDPGVFQMLSSQKFLSPDGLCYSFDHRANGYARGEGIIGIVLKPISAALRDGDTIRAVIRGTGSNQDGHTPVMTQPNLQSQEDLIRIVYQQANIPMHETRYVEAHGTGTPVGDPIEMKAIGRAFSKWRSSENPLYVGSVKANTGHLEGASGLASLVKAILILEKGIIPPNALFEKINPDIDADLYGIVVPTEPVPWPDLGLRRISVNSFGFGGSNSHIILDDAFHYLQSRDLAGHHCTHTATSPNPEPEARANAVVVADSATSGDVQNEETNLNGRSGVEGLATVNGTAHTNKAPKLLVWTAADEKALDRLIQANIPFYRDTVSRSPGRVAQLAYTLAARRGRMLWRSFAVGESDNPLSPVKASRSSTETGLVFVFTGQGAQYVDMGCDLLVYPVFATTLKQIDRIYKSYGCAWSLFDELRQPSNINKPEYSQALSTAVQIGLVDLLKSFGIVPSAVIGHSSGEISAAYASGALSLESACKVAYFRGILAEGLRVQSLSSPGAMVSINLAEDEVAEYLKSIAALDLNLFICTACVNSPFNCTLSGPEWAIDAVTAQADTDGIFAQKLTTGVAYHSPHMQCIAEEYLLLMGSLKGTDNRGYPVPVISSVSGQLVSASTLSTAQYWVDNLVSPVRFVDAIQSFTEPKYIGALGLDVVTDFVEIGAHPALRRPIEDTLRNANSEIRYSSSLHRSQDDIPTILQLAGRLFCLGYPVRIQAVNQQEDSMPFLVDCPPYPFDRSHYWAESRISRNFRTRGDGRRETLGLPVSDWNPLEPRWRNFFSVESNPWIGHHKISDTILYPAAGMLVMAIEAAHHMVPAGRNVTGYLVKGAEFINPIIVPDTGEGHVETQVRLQRVRQPASTSADAGEFDVVIFSYLQDRWSECFHAVVHVESKQSPLDTIRNTCELATKQCTHPVDAGSVYLDAANNGLQYGESFKLLRDIYSDRRGTAVAIVDVTTTHDTVDLVHPAILDQAFHVLRVAAGQLPAGNIPVKISEAWFAACSWQDTPYIQWAAIASKTRSGSGERGSIHALAQDGSVLCSVQSAVTSAVSGQTRSERENKQLLYSIEWKPRLSLLSPEQLMNRFGGRSSSNETSIIANHAMLCDALNLVTARTLNLINRQNIPDPLRKHVQWMERHVSKRLTPLQRQRAITIGESALENRLRDVDRVLPSWSLYTTCARKLPQILAGEVDPLQVVFESDQARIFYDHLFQRLCGDGRLASYLDLDAHENPALRILEVGAGTGGMTGYVLTAFQEREARTGAPSFASYNYTDISPAFFEKARLRWPDLQTDGRLAFSVLNVDKPLENQGISLESYDIVIAASVLHATPNLEATIRNVRSTLKPGGRLILLEAVNPDNVATNFMAGLVPGWWVAREDWRGHSAAVSETMWDQCLRDNGFSGSDLVLRDYNSDECHNMSIIVTTALPPPSMAPLLSKSPVMLVIDESQQQQELATVLGQYLDRYGWSSSVCIFGLDQTARASWDPDTIVVCIAEVNNRPLLTKLTEDTFTPLKRLTAHRQLLWVTGTSINDPRYPDYAAAQGLLRCLRAEQVDSHIVTLAIEDERNATSCARWVEKVLSETFLASSEELEYIVRDSLFMTGRAVKDTTGELTLRSLLENPAREAVTHSPADAITLESSEVEVDPYPCELDKLSSDQLLLGDVTGVVTRVGSSCNATQTGDRVVLVASVDMDSRPRAEERHVVKIPKAVSFGIATTIIVPGVAAYYGLVNLARIQQGDRVLIHHVTSYVGQIAIQIAHLRGAHVFATALPDKNRFVVDTLGLSEDRIVSADPTSLSADLMHLAQEKGFDILLSPLIDGHSPSALLKCVAPGGHVVEVGGADRESNRTLSMAEIPRNISFSLIDPATLHSTARTHSIGEVLRLVEEGVIKPPQPTSGASSGVEDGCVVDEVGVVSALTKPWRLSENASYLIVGGAGGIGRAILRWMADRGATNIILISRRGASSKAATDTLGELKARGVNIVAFACDASSQSELANVVNQCALTMPPIKGCINAAMVLQDAIFQDSMTFAQWELTMRSKVQTSRNLHRLLQDLDFFVLLSSLLGVTGQMASANYAAGCAFQDALARYRVARGQRALSLDLGWMRDVGIIAETEAYQRHRHTTDDMQPIDARELLALLDMCLNPMNSMWSTPQEAGGQVLFGLRTPADILREGRRPPAHLNQPLLATFSRAPSTSTDADNKLGGVESEIDAASLFQQSRDPRERARIVFRALAVKLARAMSISPDDVESEKPLSGYGVDSLMAVELRNWIVRDFAAQVAVFDIMGDVSISGIADLVVKRSAEVEARSG